MGQAAILWGIVSFSNNLNSHLLCSWVGHREIAYWPGHELEEKKQNNGFIEVKHGNLEVHTLITLPYHCFQIL